MAYSKINWQNLPSEATAINETNLNHMDDQIYTNEGNISTLQTEIVDKVDKVPGKGLSTEDYTTAEKNKLAGISAGAKNVSISDTLNDGDTIANITIDGTTTAIKATQVTIDSQLSPTSENPVQNKVVQGAFVETASHILELDESKADKNGEITSAKTSYSLLCDTPVNDNAPYTYRQFPVANAKLEKLKKLIGASVVWNQLVDKSQFPATTTVGTVTFTNNGDGSYTVNGTASESVSLELCTLPDYCIEGHKYLIRFNKNFVGSASTAELGLYRFNIANGTAHIYNDTVIEKNSAQGSTPTKVNIIVRSGYTADNLKFTPQITDLTAMFGSTIADYVNTLETNTAGSGIAWLKSYGFFTESYYAYSANTIQSVSVSGHKITGKNILAKSFEYSDNVTTDLSNYFFIRKGQYTFSFGSITATSWRFVIRLKDKNGDVLSDNAHLPIPNGFSYSSSRSGYMSNSNVTSKSIILDIVEDCYIRILFAVGDTTTSTTATSCQLEIGSTATAYSPYTEITYPLDHTTLRGLFKLDANNSLYADGDTYESDGTVTRKYGVVDLGSLDYTYNAETQRFQSSISDMKSMQNARTLPMICSIYECKCNGEAFSADWNMVIYNAGGVNIQIHNHSYTDATAFKTAMSGVYLVYELATPTTETADGYTSLQNIESGGTEEFVDYGVEQGTRDVAIPVGGERQYYQGMEIPALPTASGNHNLQFNPSSGFSWS